LKTCVFFIIAYSLTSFSLSWVNSTSLFLYLLCVFPRRWY